MQIQEGGNVFKDERGQAATQRINQTDVKTTLMWLERLLPGLDLVNNTLGSTGLKPTSGDLDVAIDSNQVTKDQLVSRLSQWAQSHGQDPREWISKSGAAVHFKTPINGNPQSGYVQTDFMFVPKPEFSKFMLRQDADSQYRGVDRNVLLNSIAKSMGYKLNQLAGIMDRATNELITDDPDRIARMLLNARATRSDLGSVEKIIAALERDSKRDDKLADARAYFQREGVPFFETVVVQDESEVNFLSRLRNRIVNLGYQPLIEQTLMEAEARIPHVEDLVFDAGTRGARQALAIINAGAKDTAGTTTVKWDGKPAIVWGRKPTGEFVLTDKSGFGARGYDGLATSPDMLASIMQRRSGERGELIELYASLWPYLSQATPQNFRGYVQGDLLYTSTPPEVSGAYEFTPNTVQYRIPVDSPLGQDIGASQVGIAVHTRYQDPGSTAEPLKQMPFRSVPGLLLIPPTVKDIKSVRVDTGRVREIRNLLTTHGAAIDQLFNPAELRAARITDLPALCKRYINSRITTNFENLLPDFGAWLQQNVTDSKYRNILEYLQSPASNAQAIEASFDLFLLLYELKMDVLQQLDRQQPGQEGWVMATDAGRAKLVNRFGFSAANRLRNNPELT